MVGTSDDISLANEGGQLLPCANIEYPFDMSDIPAPGVGPGLSSAMGRTSIPKILLRPGRNPLAGLRLLEAETEVTVP